MILMAKKNKIDNDMIELYCLISKKQYLCCALHIDCLDELGTEMIELKDDETLRLHLETYDKDID